MTTITRTFVAIVFVALFSSSAFAETYEISSETVDGYNVTGQIICESPDSQIQVELEEFIMTSVYRTNVDRWLNNITRFSDLNCKVEVQARNANPFPGYRPENNSQKNDNKVIIINENNNLTVDDYVDVDDF